MKRGLVLTLCAVALAAIGSTSQAQTVSLSLNLRYTDPADLTEGGRWFLVAKTDDTDGIAAISAYMSNVDATGIVYGNGNGDGAVLYGPTTTPEGSPEVTAATLAAILNGGNPYAGTFGGVVNVVYGQDTANGPIVSDVGQGTGTPGNTPLDPLKNTAWNNSAIIATGTFAGVRPVFSPSGANVTDANTLAGATTGVAAQDAATTFVVRGDAIRNTNGTPLNNADDTSVEGPSSGLFAGDANRDGVVNSSDLSLLLTNFNGSPRIWDQGDFNDSGNVNSSDLSLLLTNFNATDTPVSVAAVPEPSTLLLAVGAGMLSLVARRRRS